MKTYFIFLCLIVSGGFVHATTQTKADPDKPPRLYVESYKENDTWDTYSSEYGYDSNGNPTELPDEDGTIWWWEHDITQTSQTWSDGSGGNGNQIENTTGDSDPWGGGSGVIYAGMTWPASSWPDVAGGWYTNSFDPDDDDGPIGSPVIWEHCNINVPIDDLSGPWTETDYGVLDEQLWKFKYSRHADAHIMLQTGGKAKSGRQNLFQLSGSATAQRYGGKCPPPNDPDTQTIWPPLPTIHPQDIQILGESLDTNGNLYAVIPDNDTLDVTPQVKGVDYYTFNVSATKYKSYLDVYVCQPDTSFPYSDWLPGINAGHAWWCLRSDASSDIVNKITQNSVNLEYLGVQVGYGPTNGVSLWNPFTHSLDTAPGEFPWPNSDSPTVQRTYAIGFWDLIHGLNYAEGIKASPGTYTIPTCDCVTKTCEAGSAAGVSLPNDKTPEHFGFDLPPSDP